MWSFTSDKVLACTPLLILCGDPANGSIVYWFLIGAIALFAVLFTWFHLLSGMHPFTPMTFFKVTLYCEWLRESLLWRIISVLMTVWFFGFVMFMNYARSKSNGPTPQILGVNFISLPDDAPKWPTIPFLILIGSFFMQVYELWTYDEIFDQHMLPSLEFVRRHYASGYAAAEGRWNMPNVTKFIRWTLIAPFFFEPNISVEPEGMLWMITDSQTHLKNVVIVCASLNAQVQRNPSANRLQSVLQYREANGNKDPSLPWQCVQPRLLQP